MPAEAKKARARKPAAAAPAPAVALVPAPADYAAHFLEGARALKRAQNMLEKSKGKRGEASLALLTTKGEFRDIALFSLADWRRKRSEFTKARESLVTLLADYPASAYAERARAMLPDLEIGIARALQEKGENAKAAEIYLRALSRVPGREWAERENAILAAASALKAAKSTLASPFLAEAWQNLPAESPARKKLLQDVPAAEAKRLKLLPRYRDPGSVAGIKAVYPDSDLFEAGMALVLDEKWSEAQEKFKQITEQFPESEQGDRARWWTIRCDEALGKNEAAKEAFRKYFLEQPITYYGMLSALHAGMSLTESLAPDAPADKEIQPLEGTLVPRQFQAYFRARALLEAGLPDFARREFEALFQTRPAGTTIGSENAGTALALARLYFEGGYFQGAFSHAWSAFRLDRALFQKANLGLNFPDAVYKEELSAAAKANGLHPLLLRSLTKQESAFLPDAFSRANAFGLTQVLVGTAREVDEKATRADLLDAQRNARIGAAYLRAQLDRFQGNLALALAAYNAGPTRAAQWQRKLMENTLMQKRLETEILIESIPFLETRRYVSSILRNFAWYKLLAGETVPASVEELAQQWQAAAEPAPTPKN